MNKNKIIPVIAFAFILTLPFTTASAENSKGSQNTQVEIVPNSKDMSPGSNGGLDLLIKGTLKPKAVAENGALLYDAIEKVTLKDLTGKWEGWKLTAEATPLKSKKYMFPKGSLNIVEPSSVNPLSGQNEIPELKYVEKAVIDNGETLIAQAEKDTGMGGYEFKFEDASLLIAASNGAKYEEKPPSGPYETTIKWNLVSSSGETKVLKTETYTVDIDSDYLYEKLKPEKETILSKIPLLNKLPQTGENVRNYSLVGGSLIAIALGLLFFRRKKKK